MLSLTLNVNNNKAVLKLNKINESTDKAITLFCREVENIVKSRAKSVIGGNTGSNIADSVINTGTKVYTEDPIAIHKQKGGIIKAKQAQVLKIPIPGAENRQDEPGVWVISRNGNLVLLSKADGDLLAVGKEEVNQRAFPWWVNKDESLDILRRNLSAKIKEIR